MLKTTEMAKGPVLSRRMALKRCRRKLTAAAVTIKYYRVSRQKWSRFYDGHSYYGTQAFRPKLISTYFSVACGLSVCLSHSCPREEKKN